MMGMFFFSLKKNLNNGNFFIPFSVWIGYAIGLECHMHFNQPIEEFEKQFPFVPTLSS